MILVTGATGHIGNVLVQKLLSLGRRVRALVLPGEDLTPLQGLAVECCEGDVLNPATLHCALEGVRNVFHLAGIISTQPGSNSLLQQVNVQGTLNLLGAARGKNIHRLIYTSSIHAIRRAPHGVIIDEQIPFDPHHCAGEYDRTKAEASLAVLEAARQNYLDTVIVCPTGVIGPYDYRLSETGRLILDCTRRKTQLWINGGYDFVDVRDVASGLILAAEQGRRGETYILSGERISLLRIAEIVGEVTGKRLRGIRIPILLAKFAALFVPLYCRLSKSRPLFTPYALETVLSNSVISNAKARRELGYKPRPIRDSIADTVRWLRENRTLPGLQAPGA
jgi:dihydroflavonol-4-reductase